jgi:outer membrane receptor protein involved in Fe transport
MARNLRNKLIASWSIVAALVGVPLVLLAQEPPSGETPAVIETPATEIAPVSDDLERMIVTGTLIPTAETEGALPVTTYTAETLKKFGATNLAEALRSLPSYYGNTPNENDSLGGTGAAVINLRALGTQYTLTLINNRRVSGNKAGFEAGAGFADLNLIPENFVDNIEILKDGATTRYGSDAVAGVANITLKKIPQGEYGEIDFKYGNTTNNDQAVINFTAIGGFADDRVSVTGGYDYYHRNAIYARDRFVSASSDGKRFGGRDISSTLYPGQATIVTAVEDGFVFGVNDVAVQDIRGVPTTTDDYGLVAPLRVRRVGIDEFNFQTQSPSRPEFLRNSVYAQLDAKIFDKYLEFFGTFLYTQRRFYNGAASSPDFFGFETPLAAPLTSVTGVSLLDETQILTASPYYPSPATGRRSPVGTPITEYAVGDIYSANYRSLELGPRTNTIDATDYLFQGGFRGEIPSFSEKLLLPINWEIGYTSEEFRQRTENNGDYIRQALLAEIAAGNFNPFIAQDAPRQGFVTIGGVTYNYDNEAALERAAYKEDQIVRNVLRAIDGNIRTTFFPDSFQGGVTLALGAEYRWEDFVFAPGPVAVSGQGPGFNALQPFSGQRESAAFFGELLIPVVTPDMNIPGVYALDATVALRYERFNVGGVDPDPASPSFNDFVTNSFASTDPKVHVRYQPFKDLTLRGSYSTAFVAPNVFQLFSTPQISFPEVFNANTGETVQPAGGIIIQGNPALRPETAEIFTGGVVYTPSFAPGQLTLSVDYYGIYQDGLISIGDAQFVLDQFFASGGTVFADRVTFLPNGDIDQVNTIAFNSGRREVEGLDFNLIYQTPEFKWGTFTFTAAWNYVLKYRISPSPGAEFIDFTDKFNNTSAFAPGSIPYWKGYLDLNYQFGGFQTGIKFNYIADVQDDNTGVIVEPVERRVREWYTFDWRASYLFKRPEEVVAENGLTKSGYGKEGKAVAPPPPAPAKPSIWSRLLGGTELQVGVLNIFDEPPPFGSNAFNDNYDTSLYNNVGRFWYVGIQKKL